MRRTRAPEPLVLALWLSIILPACRSADADQLRNDVLGGHDELAARLCLILPKDDRPLTMTDGTISGITPPVFDAHSSEYSYWVSTPMWNFKSAPCGRVPRRESRSQGTASTAAPLADFGSTASRRATCDPSSAAIARKDC